MLAVNIIGSIQEEEYMTANKTNDVHKQICLTLYIRHVKV